MKKRKGGNGEKGKEWESRREERDGMGGGKEGKERNRKEKGEGKRKGRDILKRYDDGWGLDRNIVIWHLAWKMEERDIYALKK